MQKTTLLVEGAILSIFSTAFQLIPVIFSETYVFFTIISTIPIYLITRKNYKVGFATLITTSLLILLFSNL